MTKEATAVLLAGGRSSRFGSDKALAPWRGKPLIAQVTSSLSRLFDRTLVTTKSPAALRFLERPRVDVLEDASSDFHPLHGIASALRACATPYAFVWACDMPFVRPGLVRALWEARSEYSAVVPVWDGAPQPLCGFYHVSCGGVAELLAREGSAGVCDLFKVVPTRFLLPSEVRAADPRGRSFVDIDTPADYRRAARLR